MRVAGSELSRGHHRCSDAEPGTEGANGALEPPCPLCPRLAPNPMDDAGLLSFATFSWLTPVMVRGYKRTLTVDSLPPLSKYDSSDVNAKRCQGSLGAPLERTPSPGRRP